jgi:outer membrane protein
MKVAQDTLANLEAHLRQTEGFVQAGTHPEIDLLQAKTDAANARVQSINAENTYETSKVALNAAMGVLGTTDYDVSDDSLGAVQNEDANVGPLLEEAIKSRPEVENIEKLVRADQLTVSSIRGNYFPSISATAGFNQGGTSLFDDAKHPNLTWNAFVGLSLTWNIFQGGLTTAQAEEAEANVQAEQAGLDLLQQQLRSDVDAARLAVRAAKASTSATQEALQNAKERLRLAEQRYQVGVGSAIELGDAQVALTQASAQAVQADDNLAVARAQLLRALGRQ